MRLAERPSKGPSIGPLTVLFPVILLLLLFTTATNAATNLPNLSTVSQPDGSGTAAAATNTKATATGGNNNGKSATAKTTAAAGSNSASSVPTVIVTSAPGLTTSNSNTDSNTDSSNTAGAAATTVSLSVFHLTGLPTIAGAGIPTVIVPDTANAPFMQKSNLPDGTVFICVGAALGFMGAAILAWRGLVAWSLHRSVQRAALAQNLADSKTLLHGPGGGNPTHRHHGGLYKTVGASSTMSLDRLSAAPPPLSKPPRPAPSAASSSSFPSAAAAAAAAAAT
ncbi:hypothetical protein AOQ84DRAFT_223326, partial [Glonium stellatum]